MQPRVRSPKPEVPSIIAPATLTTVLSIERENPPPVKAWFEQTQMQVCKGRIVIKE
jgi:hypothetical protein